MPEVIGGPERINTSYVPRPHQHRLHTELKRFNVLVCHRRFGKTVFCINHMIDRATRLTLPMPRFAYIAPTYGQAKRVAWDYLKMYTSKIPNIVVNEADLRVELPHNKGRIMLLSAENPASLRGIYLDGCLMDEFGEMNPQAWHEVIRPTLSDRRGWCSFIGTPKGQNHFHEMYEYACGRSEYGMDPEWFGAMHKASETGIISQKELESARRSMSQATYDQEYECSFDAGVVGAYFTSELARARDEQKICDVSHEAALPVTTYWDLGMDDATAVWFVQSKDGEHRVIDYYETCGSGLPDVLIELRKKPYFYGTFVMPHDIKVRDYSTGKTRLQTLYNLGVRNVKVVPKVDRKMESIDAARRIIPKCRFDQVKCADGLKALANYQKKWNHKNNVFENNPLHSWAAHAADAFQQFGMGAVENSRGTGFVNRSSSVGVESDTDYDPLAC